MKRLGICLLLVFTLMLVFTACSDSSSHKGEAKTPSGSSIQKGRAYQDVVAEFTEKGFINVRTEVVEDLVTGWTTKEGEVESVSVDGNIDYAPDVWYSNTVEVVVTYHTFPKDASNKNQTSESSTSSIKEPTQQEEKPLTPDNSEEFAALLSAKDNNHDLFEKFVSKYQGKIIEFDGCIIFLVNHEKNNTRYDLMISAGDYVNEDTANPGPVFKFDDVGITDMGIKDLWLPSFVSVGNNVRIKAKVVTYDRDSQLFILNPILIEER